MTDKKEFDQEEMHTAFERLNEKESLQPSAELDALILQMAADEVQAEKSVDTSKPTDITDISFRRGRRESHKALKKKGVLPNWLMPMGLAATVLISFGVVNRVLQSPEFANMAKSDTYESVADDAIITGPPAKDINKPLAPAAEIVEPEPEYREAQAAIAAPTSTTSPELDKRQMQNSDAIAQEIEVNSEYLSDTTQLRNEVNESINAEKISARKQKEQSEYLVQQERAAAARSKRERLVENKKKKEGVVDFSIQKPQLVGSIADSSDSTVVAMAPPQASSKTEMRTDIDSIVELQDQNIPAEPGFSDEPAVQDNELEEIVVTGARMKVDESSAVEMLAKVLFEHKQCQVAQDCALLALECDSCGCLDVVNNEHYKKYQSEFSKAEIAEQCVNTTVECVRNYCQVEETE